MKWTLGVLVTTLALGVISAPAASAATGSSEVSITSSGNSAARAARISCTLTISNPHNSLHRPKNINVIAPVSCSSTVAHIKLTVRLYRNGKKVKAKRFNKSSTKFLKGTASMGCKNGNYQGVADVRVTFPPRYLPAVTTGHLVSKTLKISC
ncbi:MAG: hypothetical protein JWN52_4743 [Actinomycetia bacterium]|nr:hypothetical protein [Actinomycetes bacterium]